MKSIGHCFALLMVAALTMNASAQEAAELAQASVLSWKFFAAALAVAVATIGPGLALGRAVATYFEAIGRNPEAEPQISKNFFPGLAFIEALTIYGLLVALILLFAV